MLSHHQFRNSIIRMDRLSEAPCSEDRLDLSVETFHTEDGDEGTYFTLVGERDNGMSMHMYARDKDITREATYVGHAVKYRF